jgi:hypothetical protein
MWERAMPAIWTALATLPAAPLHTPFQRTLAGAHIPVMLDMSPSGAHTPLEGGMQRHGLRSGIRIAGMARSHMARSCKVINPSGSPG